MHHRGTKGDLPPKDDLTKNGILLHHISGHRALDTRAFARALYFRNGSTTEFFERYRGEIFVKLL